MRGFSKFGARSLPAVGLACFLATPALAGGVYTELFNFDCATDGCDPLSPALLAQGEDGVLYSTLQNGTVQSSDGTIIDYAPGGTVDVLYRFQGQPPDGLGPQSGLTLGFDGALYGATTNGGVPGKGTVFRLFNGAMTVLYQFTDGDDGAYPWAPPVQTPDGNLYGVTYNGTNPGRAYRITPSGKFSVIASLPSKTTAPLVMGVDGNFYGTTQYGGASNQGTVFRLSSKGKLTIIHSFDGSHEGATPIAPVMIGADGKFYGTTSGGGQFSQGIVYRLASSGNGYQVLHNFQVSEGTSSTAGLVQGSDNYLYSVQSAGGANGYGTMYRVNTRGTKFRVLHQFTFQDGAYPGATPTLQTNGTIYGFATKGGGGENGTSGVLFSYTHGLKPFISLQLWAGPEGTQVGILGQGFSTATGVEFGGVVANYTVMSDTYMAATVPVGAQTAKVTVLEPSGDLVTLRKFKVLSGARKHS
ncbi:MAG TPA: choice-of-anchor tandem repeat GloVer-containing protein [Rhizomicrobium sp.]|nr:choice-of-anchor tandem repeat GloVer-containing protein [Rhizomicrobium sp.]